VLHAALDDIAALYDRARSLQDELTTRLTEETNRRLYIVSVVTTLFMPATFITVFFGMNTDGLLWAATRCHTAHCSPPCFVAVLSV
jgi:Mg2+ and Co2+ transporter CorA